MPTSLPWPQKFGCSEGPSSKPNSKWWWISIIRILTYLAIALTSDANSSKPSDEPNCFSLDRSGWGIIPRTLLPSFSTPAMQLMDPLGLAPEVTSPDGVQWNATRSLRSSSARVSGSRK